MKRLLFSFVVCFVAVLIAAAAKFPAELPKCHFGDAECLVKTINSYIRAYKDGYISANIVPLDPLHVNEVNIIQATTSPVNIQLNFKNASFHGLRSAHVTKVIGFDRDPTTSKFEIYMKIKQVSLIGPYKVRGSVIILPIRGSGPANLTLDNIECSLKLIPKVEVKNGKQYVLFTETDFNFSTTRLWMKFENLFGGKDRLLSDTTNTFLNENWSEILKELKPVLRKAIGDIAGAVVGQVFAKFPYDSLFLD